MANEAARVRQQATMGAVWVPPFTKVHLVTVEQPGITTKTITNYLVVCLIQQPLTNASCAG